VKRLNSKTLGWLGAFSLLVAGLLILPVASVVASFLGGASDLWGHLAATALPRYVGNTALLLVGVACGVISIGVVAAWLVTAYRFPGRGWLEWALLLPLAMPAYVMAYAYTDWLQFSGPVQSALRALTGWQAREYWFPEVRSLAGAVAMLAFALYPYVYLVARTAFHDLSRSAIEAGRLAGYGALGAFIRVAVPLARPAIVAGATLALMETLADFGTVSYFGVEVFTTGIFKAWLSMGDAVAAAQLSTCLLGFVAVLLALERVNRGRAAYHGMARRELRPHRLRGGAAAAAFVACAAPVVFGFALPALVLVALALHESISPARLVALVGNSFGIAALTALIAVGIALLMAYAGRLTRSRLVAGANRLAGLGYAVPMTPFGSWSCDLSEAEAAAMLAAMEGADILVSHAPPQGLADVSSRGVSLVSRAIRAAIERAVPRYCRATASACAKTRRKFSPSSLRTCSSVQPRASSPAVMFGKPETSRTPSGRKSVPSKSEPSPT